MSFESGLFAHEMTGMFLQIEACQWSVCLSLLEAENAEHDTHHELFCLNRYPHYSRRLSLTRRIVWNVTDNNL